MKSCIFHYTQPLHCIAILSKPTPIPEFPSIPAARSRDSVLIPRWPITLPLPLIIWLETPTLASPSQNQTIKLYYNFHSSLSTWRILCSPPNLPTQTESMNSKYRWPLLLLSYRKCANNSPLHPTTHHMASLLTRPPLPPHLPLSRSVLSHTDKWQVT
jgi:hypothetical protein